MTAYHAEDADWSVLTALKSAYDAYRDNYVPLTAVAMIWLMPIFLLEALQVNPRLQVLYVFVVGALLMIGLAPSVSESLLGHPVRLGECLVMSFTKLRLTAPMLALIMVLGVAGALVLLVLPGLYLLAAWSVAGPVMAAEKLGATTALRRSMILTRRRIFRVGSVVVIWSVIVFFLVMGGQVLAAAIATETLQWSRLIGFIVQSMLLALTACLATVLYCLLRFDKEGITLELVSDTLH